MFTKSEILPLFPCYVFFFDVEAAPALGPALCRLVDEQRQSVPSVPRGEHQGGWQSDTRFFTAGEAASSLRDVIATAVLQLHPSNQQLPGMNLVGWANRLERGDHFSPHTHSGAWSGAYYADAGDSGVEHGGLLMLRDPRAGANVVESPLNRFDSACSFQVPPRTGQLVVFPAFLLHWVTPYRGERPRVSVSFNAW